MCVPKNKQIMIITINSGLTQPKPSNANSLNACDVEVLKQTLNNILEEKGEKNNAVLNWKDTDSVEVSGISNIALHKFMLKAEQLGKGIVYEKKTIIKITD